jgi:hypothetical protein
MQDGTNRLGIVIVAGVFFFLGYLTASHHGSEV